MIEDWNLMCTNLRRVRGRKYELAVLPVGSMESHNLHLPYGMDFIQANHVARESCRRAWQRCPAVACLPALPYSVDANLLAYPMTIHTDYDVVGGYIRQVVGSLVRHGLRKFVLLNGHGGNEFMPLVRQLQHELGVHLFLMDWWRTAADQYGQIFSAPDDHAGQMETSVALAICPELVELDQAADGAVRPFRFEACRRGWARTSRDFGKMSDHCAAGNPAGASAEKGRQYLELCISRIADFLVELAQAPIDEHFPFEPETRPYGA